MDAEEEARLRDRVTQMLASGLATEIEPFPITEREFGAITNELRKLHPDDVEGKLVVGGFLDHPYGPENWRCMECIYYLVNRRWCDLPELSLPVEPEWYCKLWRM